MVIDDDSDEEPLSRKKVAKKRTSTAGDSKKAAAGNDISNGTGTDAETRQPPHRYGRVKSQPASTDIDGAETSKEALVDDADGVGVHDAGDEAYPEGMQIPILSPPRPMRRTSLQPRKPRVPEAQPESPLHRRCRQRPSKKRPSGTTVLVSKRKHSVSCYNPCRLLIIIH